MTFIHQAAAQGGWSKLSLAEQLGNIGSEVARAARRQGEDEQRFREAVWRALDLFDLTLADSRWAGRRREIARAREVFCDAASGGALYESSLPGLVPYFDRFAFAARNGAA